MLATKEYCIEHKPIGRYTLFAGYSIFIHGYQHGTDDIVYVSEVYGTTTKYHKVKIRYNHQSTRPFVALDNKRFYLDEFIKIEPEVI